MIATIREHHKGQPFTRDIPAGCKPKSDCAKDGMILIDGATPAAWILMGDNYHEYAVFGPDQVIPGKIAPKPGKRVTYEQLERLFEEYCELEPHADDLYQESGYYCFSLWMPDHNKHRNVELSGHCDSNSGRIAPHGNRQQAYAKLKVMIEKKRAELEESNKS